MAKNGNPTHFQAETQPKVEEFEINLELAHRPLNANSPAHLKFSKIFSKTWNDWTPNLIFQVNSKKLGLNWDKFDQLK